MCKCWANLAPDVCLPVTPLRESLLKGDPVTPCNPIAGIVTKGEQ